MLAEGTWYLSSKSDPRWSTSGRGTVGGSDPRWSTSGRGTVGGFVMSPEAEARLAELKSQLGDPPADLTWGYMKD